MPIPRKHLQIELASILRLPPDAVSDDEIDYLLSLLATPDALKDHLFAFACGSYTDEELGELQGTVEHFVARLQKQDNDLFAGDIHPHSESDEPEDELFEGEHFHESSNVFCCGCEGLHHDVKMNCVNCGRVHCNLETNDRCLFCKADIRESTILGAVENEESFTQALNRTKRLLGFQKESAKRTKVIDENVDWFEEGSNPWLSAETRKFAQAMAAKEQRDEENLRKRAAIAIDLATRKVIDMRAQMEEDLEREQRAAFQHFQVHQKVPVNISSTLADEKRTTENSMLYDDVMAHLRGLDDANIIKAGQGDQMNDSRNKPWRKLIEEAARAGAHHQAGVGRRFAPEIELDEALGETDALVCRDDDLHFQEDEMVPLKFALPKDLTNIPDKGVVLSLHQPWASLIIEGFKRCEGRGWTTEYRGPLWIHAASKPLEPEIYYSVRDKYLEHYASLGIQMPPFPPMNACPESALLGRVVLADVVENTDVAATECYFASRTESWWPPLEDNGSDHLFICVNPERLMVPITMSGQHKLWRLKPRDVEAFGEALRPVKWPEQDGLGENEEDDNFTNE